MSQIYLNSKYNNNLYKIKTCYNILETIKKKCMEQFGKKWNNHKELWIKLQDIIWTGDDPKKAKEYQRHNIYDDVKTFSFRKWNWMDHKLFDIINKNYPREEYGEIIYFLLNEYNPDIYYIDISQYCQKAEYDEELKLHQKRMDHLEKSLDTLGLENERLKLEIVTIREKHAQENMENIKKCIASIVNDKLQKKERLHRVYCRMERKYGERKYIRLIKKSIKHYEKRQQKRNHTTSLIPNLQECTLNNCYINCKIKNNTSSYNRKEEDNNNTNCMEDKIKITTEEILQLIREIVLNQTEKNQTIRLELETCLECKKGLWENNGFVCIGKQEDEENKNEPKKVKKIFLKKGEESFKKLLQIINYDLKKIKDDNSDEKNDDDAIWSMLKKSLLKTSRVRISHYPTERKSIIIENNL